MTVFRFEGLTSTIHDSKESMQFNPSCRDPGQREKN